MVRNVLEFLEHSAEQFPDKLCFEESKEAVTFSQLEYRAKQIGSFLAGTCGKNEPVAILMQKSVSMITAMMGVVYSRNFYAPLDVLMPKKRIELILGKLQPKLILTDQGSMDLAGEMAVAGGRCKVVCIGDLAETTIDAVRLDQLRRESLDTDPLYVIFTSGSTGIPKGVINSHRAVISFVQAFTGAFDMNADEIHGNQAPLDYDASVKDIFTTLFTGGKTYLIPQTYFSMPKQLLDCLEEQGITTLVWAVSAVRILAELKAFQYKVPHKVKKVLFSGSVMPCKYLRVWQHYLPDAMYVNLYGATETTCNSTYYVVDHLVEDGEELPLGRPFTNMEILLLDETMSAAKRGQISEIYVRGAGLSLGYYKEPEKDAEVFVQNPQVNAYQERIFRSGDLASLQPDGSLKFHGRRDHMIKHLGHRIELGEIENTVLAFETVKECCCLYETEKSDIYLFYTGEASKKEIVLYLRERLPRYMYPSKYVPLLEMPKLSNGKTDRTALKCKYIK